MLKEQQLKIPKIKILISLTIKKIFEFNSFQKEQIKVIIIYLSNKNIFISMKIDKGKILYYVILAIYFENLTIIFNLLKILIDNQKIRI